MTYTPDIRDYQQLDEPRTGRYDCTAYAAAIVTDAHTGGKTRVTGRQVRLASSEPVPDPKSPGLNLPQVDAAVRSLTSGRVDLDTRLALPRAEAQSLIVDGRWAIVQVKRSVLVNRGFLSGFRGAHALTVHALDVPVLGDPLVPYYVRCSWDALWDAADALIGLPGRANVSLTRDLTPDYRWTCRPNPPHDRRAFGRFRLEDGRIVRRDMASTAGMSVRCTAPRFYPWPGHVGRSLVRITEGSRKGWWVDARFAEEMVP